MRDSSAAASCSAAVAHPADFAVELHQSRFDFSQLSPRLLAGFLRLLHRSLDCSGAGAECSGQIFAGSPDDDARDNREVEQKRKE